MKSFPSSSLAVAAICALAFAPPLLADKTSGNYTYITNTTGVTITGFVEKPEGPLRLPAKIEGKTVTEIGYRAFHRASRSTPIVIPEGVTKIGEEAFHRCTVATAISLPESLESIGSRAFGGCESLKSIDIPEGVTDLQFGAFQACSELQSARLPRNLETLPDFLFERCVRLREITIPRSVTSIGQWSFNRCSALKTVNIPASVVEIGPGAFGSSAQLAQVKLSEGLQVIASGAMRNCPKLLHITIPATVTTIGSDAFRKENGSMKSATFLGNAPAMGQRVFDGGDDDGDFTVFYQEGAEGFTSPTWLGYPSQAVPAGPPVRIEQPVGTPLEDGISKKSFGSVYIGRTGGTKTFTVTNTGDTVLTGLAVTIDGANAADFKLLPPNKTSVGPGESRVFKVTFAPKGGGDRRATLHLRVDGFTTNPFDVKLAGFGVGKP